jgi:hypothetical protein
MWLGFFGGWEPSWRNLPLSQAPEVLRDPHQRLRLTSFDMER